MSLASVPFVGTGADTALHVAAAVVMLISIVAIGYGFWRIHELPISKAHATNHQQMGLITALTWIGFIWHWVWVLAIILAFVDMEKAIIRLRDLWHQPTPNPEPPHELPSSSNHTDSNKQEDAA